jgi:D-glycero-D-manno-heptose 1,7-bisphosphate phosphatase
MKHPAVFLDRDGTIIDDVGYIKDPDLINFLPGALDALTLFRDAGFLLVVVTNQSGIARGIFTLDELLAVRDRFCDLLKKRGIALVDYRFCPHHPNGSVDKFRQTCTCRKPAPGMLLAAAEKNNIDLKKSWMIGDKPDDIRAGLAAGTRTIQLIPANSSPLDNPQPDFYAENLLKAAKIITGQF